MNIPRMSAAVAVLALCGGAALAQSAAPRPDQAPTPKWFRGNIHAHTSASDGDSAAADVVRVYRELQYDFLVLTDHNLVTPIDGLLDASIPAPPPPPPPAPGAAPGVVPAPAAPRPFLLIPGTEVTGKVGQKAVHVNGLGTTARVLPSGGDTVLDALQREVDAVVAVSGLPVVNHPNFSWAVTAADLKAVQRVQLFELYNAHPQCNNIGGGGAPGVEEIWDDVLSTGRTLWGVAADDMHDLKRPWAQSAARPGQAWVMVRARELSQDALFDALRRGDFYASTGVELLEYSVTATGIRIAVKENSMRKYRVLFIGKNGRTLKDVPASSAEYAFTGDEGYVRTKVIESYGKLAWTQPVLVAASRK